MPGKTGLHLRCTCTTETLETAYPIPVRRWSRFRRFTQSRRVRLPPVVGTTCPADKAMAARAPGGPALTAGDLALSVVEMPPGACALTRSVEDVPCSVPAHFAIFRFQLSGYVPVFFRNALAQDLHARKRRSLLLPARHLGPDGALCKGGATDVQPHPRLPASGNGGSDATMPSSPGKDGSTSGPPPWKAHLQSASTVFRSCPSYRRRPFGSIIVSAAWLAQVRQEAEFSLRSERGLRHCRCG